MKKLEKNVKGDRAHDNFHNDLCKIGDMGIFMLQKMKSGIAPYLFLFPSFLIYFVFILLPILTTAFYSFTDFNLNEYNFVGLNNYVNLFKDDIFLKALFNTIQYSIGVVVLCMVFGLLIAVALNESWFPCRKLFRSVIYMPNIISVVAAAMIWLYMYDSRNGVINQLLGILNLSQPNWLFDERYALACIGLVAIWQGVGYSMIVYLSGLQGIPVFLYEAALIDGASKVRQFFSITVPLLVPTTFFLMVMNVVTSFQVFGQVYIMTSGGPLNSTTTIVHQIYMKAFQNFRMGYASSMAIVMLLMTLIVTAVLTLYNRRKGGAEFD